MYYALLDFRFGIYCFYCICKAGQPINAGDQYIIGATGFYTVQHRKPKLCTFIFANLHSESPSILIPIAIYTAFLIICPSLLTWKCIASINTTAYISSSGLDCHSRTTSSILSVISLFVAIIVLGVTQFIVKLSVKTVFKHFSDHHFKYIFQVIKIFHIESFHDVTQILLAAFCRLAASPTGSAAVHPITQFWRQCRIKRTVTKFRAVEPFAALGLLKPIPFDALLMLFKNLCKFN